MEIKEHISKFTGQRGSIRENLKKYIILLKRKIQHNICGTANAVLRGKFIAINAHFRKEKKAQIN